MKNIRKFIWWKWHYFIAFVLMVIYPPAFEGWCFYHTPPEEFND